MNAYFMLSQHKHNNMEALEHVTHVKTLASGRFVHL